MFLGSHYQRVVTKEISDISSNTAENSLCLRQYSAVSASSYATREILLSDFVTPNATSLEPLSGDFLVFRTLLSVYAQHIVLFSIKINH